MRELYHLLNLEIDPLPGTIMPISVRHNAIDRLTVNPVLVEMLRSVNISPTNGAIFYSPPEYKTAMCHVDCVIDNALAEWPSLAKMNYTVGDKNTHTMWYDVPVEKRRQALKSVTSIKQPFQAFMLHDCIIIDTFITSGWHLFEAGVPHTVLNPTRNPKWTISFVMRDTGTAKWLTYNECKTRLSKLNI